MAAVTRETVEHPLQPGGSFGLPDVTTDSVTTNPLDPGGGNTITEVIQALGAQYYWRLSESNPGPFANSGTDSTQLVKRASISDIYSRAWGPTRGEPREFAVWQTSDQSVLTFSGGGGIAASGWTTGAFHLWIFMADIVDNTENFVMSQTMQNNSGLHGSLVVSNTGVLTFEVTSNDNPRIFASTAAGTIQPMQWYQIVGVQRGDGTGLHIYVDGVDATSTSGTAGSATVDSFFDDILGGFTGPVFGVGTQFTTFPSSGPSRKGVALPAVFRNISLSDADVLTLFNAVNRSGTPEDYMEVFESLLVDQDLRYWWNGIMDGSGNQRAFDLGYEDLNGNFQLSGSGMFTAPSSPNNLVSDGPNTAYDVYESVYGSNNPTLFTLTGDFRGGDSATAGTINAWVSINSIAAGERIFFAPGQNAVTRGLEMGVDGARLFCRVFNPSPTNLLQRIVSVTGPLLVAGGTVYMLTATQDGSQLRIYIDGVEVTGSDVDETIAGTATAGSWMSFIGSPAAWAPRWGGIAGSQSVDNWSPNGLRTFAFSQKALTPVQVAELYAAGEP